MFRTLIKRILKFNKTQQEDSSLEMRLTGIKWRQAPPELYASATPCFAWVGKSVDGIRTQVSDFNTCREVFISYLRTYVCSSRCIVPKNRLIFLFAKSISPRSSPSNKEEFQKKFTGDVRRGIKILNAFETHLGWTKSRMYNVVGGTSCKHARAFLIAGSGRWLRSPQHVSLYCLMLRCGEIEAFESIKTVAGFFEIANNVLSKSLGGPNAVHDRNFLKKTRKYWLTFLENSDTLYKGRDLVRNFHKKYLAGDSGFHEGISTLVSLDSCDADLNERWIDLNNSLKEQKG